MNNTDITDKLKEKEVDITARNGLSNRDKHYCGIILYVKPEEYFLLKDNLTGRELPVPFCGRFEGVHTITDKDGRKLYENETALKKYSNWGFIEESPFTEPETRRNIARQGRFY